MREKKEREIGKQASKRRYRTWSPPDGGSRALDRKRHSWNLQSHSHRSRMWQAPHIAPSIGSGGSLVNEKIGRRGGGLLQELAWMMSEPHRLRDSLTPFPGRVLDTPPHPKAFAGLPWRGRLGLASHGFRNKMEAEKADSGPIRSIVYRGLRQCRTRSGQQLISPWVGD